MRHPLVDEVASALRRVPGLALTRALASEIRCRFDMTVDSWNALLLLAAAGGGANVRFGTYAQHDAGSKEAAADPCRAVVHRYPIEAADESEMGEALQALGAHLVWGIHRLGWITTDEANRALRVLHAAPIGPPAKPRAT